MFWLIPSACNSTSLIKWLTNVLLKKRFLSSGLYVQFSTGHLHLEGLSGLSNTIWSNRNYCHPPPQIVYFPLSISSHHHISVSRNKSPPSSAPSIELFTEYNCIFFEYSLRLWIYQFLYVIISTSLKQDFILFLFLDYLTVSKMVSLSSITFHSDAPSIYLSEWYF